MIKRVWGLLSVPSAEPDTSDADVDSSQDESQYSSRRKRQKREHSASEQSSPASVTRIDQFQQRNFHRSYSKKTRKFHRRRRRNRNRYPHPYRCMHHYGYTDCEAEWEHDDSSTDDDDDSSTGEENFERVRDSSPWRKHKKPIATRIARSKIELQPESPELKKEQHLKTVPKARPFTSSKVAGKPAPNPKRKPEQQAQSLSTPVLASDDSPESISSDDSKGSKAEQHQKTVPKARPFTSSKVAGKPAPKLKRKPEQQPQLLSTPLLDSKEGEAEQHKKTEPKARAVACSTVARQHSLSTPVLASDDNPESISSDDSKGSKVEQHQKTVPKARPFTGSKVARKPAPNPKRKPEQQSQLLSTPLLASDGSSESISNDDSKEGEADQHQKTVPKARAVACSTVARKPAPEPKQKPEQQSLSAPLLTPDDSSESISSDDSKGQEADWLFYDSDSSLDDSDSSLDDMDVLDDTGCMAFNVEIANQGAFDKLRIKSLWAATKSKDDNLYTSSEDEARNQKISPTTVSPITSGLFAVGQRVRVKETYSRSHKRGKCGTIIALGKNRVSFNVKLDHNGRCYTFNCSSLEALDITSGLFAAGQRVRVKETYSKSQKRGKCGTIIALGRNRVSFDVKLDHNQRCYTFNCSSLEALDGSTPKPSVQQKQPGSKTTNTKKTRKKNAGKKQSKTTRKKGNGAPPAPSAEAQEWIAPQTIVQKGSFWGIRNAKIVLPGDPKDENCFLKHVLKDQRLSLEVPLKKGEPVDKGIIAKLQGRFGNYEMVSAKIFDEKSNYEGQGYHSNAKKYARVTYAAASSSFSIQDQLLRIADFTSLNPRKIAARLELLQSPTTLQITHHNKSLFREIPDRGYVGGGFIHEDKLAELLELAGMGPTAAGRAIAIQVRIFIPSMGIFKGMLVKKRTKNGAPIELPWSMKKVMASTHPERFKGAKILINKHKVHPSSGNILIGKKLDPSQDDPKDETFKENVTKLKPTIFPLWETLGVPADLCERYRIESFEPNRRNHAWLVGVPDPTGSLPPDTIFVPGMKKKDPYDIFVARFPCYAREHGRKFRAITRKPQGMSEADWDWLNNNFSFGAVMFSNPRPGMMSIPERIANGDLDGDLYMVCWDKEVVDSMTRVVPLVDQPAEDDGKLSTVPSDPEWFSKSQKMHFEKLRSEYGQLVGQLYNLAKKKVKNSKKKLDDPDARALYEAYNEALEYTKHGRPIRVPRHLIKELKKELHPFVQPID